MTLFPPRREPNVNYDWIDVDSATGYVLYDGWGAKLSTGNTYHLTPSNDADELLGSIAAQDNTGTVVIVIAADGTHSTFTQMLDIDFDTTPFQLPRAIQGQALVRVGLFLHERAASGDDYSCYIIAKLRKYSGGEVEIASTQSATFSTTDSTSEEWSVTMPIAAPLTTFKKGDHLRLTIEVWTKADVNGTHRAMFGCWPADLAHYNLSLGNSRLTAAIPFRVNL